MDIRKYKRKGLSYGFSRRRRYFSDEEEDVKEDKKETKKNSKESKNSKSRDESDVDLDLDFIEDLLDKKVVETVFQSRRYSQTRTKFRLKLYADEDDDKQDKKSKGSKAEAKVDKKTVEKWETIAKLMQKEFSRRGLFYSRYQNAQRYGRRYSDLGYGFRSRLSSRSRRRFYADEEAQEAQAALCSDENAARLKEGIDKLRTDTANFINAYSSVFQKLLEKKIVNSDGVVQSKSMKNKVIATPDAVKDRVDSIMSLFAEISSVVPALDGEQCQVVAGPALEATMTTFYASLGLSLTSVSFIVGEFVLGDLVTRIHKLHELYEIISAGGTLIAKGIATLSLGGIVAAIKPIVIGMVAFLVVKKIASHFYQKYKNKKMVECLGTAGSYLTELSVRASEAASALQEAKTTGDYKKAVQLVAGLHEYRKQNEAKLECIKQHNTEVKPKTVLGKIADWAKSGKRDGKEQSKDDKG